MATENGTTDSDNIVRFFSGQTMWVLNEYLNTEEEYRKWVEMTGDVDKSIKKFLKEKQLKADAEYKARYGYDPPKNGWD